MTTNALKIEMKYPLLLLLFTFPNIISAHSWVEKVDGGHGEGMSRIGMNTKSDTALQRYFCPLETLDACEPDPKHNIILSRLESDPMRPCRSDETSDPRASVMAGDDLHMNWAGNGHVGNGQSDGTCVRVMITHFEADPNFEDFVEIPGADCLDYWITTSDNRESPEGTITIPDNLEPGMYTLLWYWNFTEFWYSSCIDLDVLPNDGTTQSPTASPTRELNDAVIQDYLKNGCSHFDEPDVFCRKYTTEQSAYCEDRKDECGRSACLYADFLLPCPECPPPHDGRCPEPKAFYDDFSNGLDPAKWLVAHKSWGGGKDGFTNGGVVEENVEIESNAQKVIFHAHGSEYTGDVMGINKDLSRQTTGVRTGGAIATRDYFGAGSYEVRMKVAEELGVCSAIWTFFYNDDGYYDHDGEEPIINHEIDIELPGRPGAANVDIGFDRALLNTWVTETEFSVNYTPLPSSQDDGQFHTWRFDWHTDPAEQRVDFFLDGQLLKTEQDHIPFNAGRLWLGAWFPNKWAGEPSFEQAQMEVDYVRFTPFLDESYECPEESYPNFGWAPGTNFTQEEKSPTSDVVDCTSPPAASPVTVPGPVTSAPVPPPQGNDDDVLNTYYDNGCKNLHEDFCATKISGSYCKDWNSDDCGRSICQSDSYDILNPCPLDDMEEYLDEGCGDLVDSFCSAYNGGWCKTSGLDSCGRAVCKGDSHFDLNPCAKESESLYDQYKANGCIDLPESFCSTYNGGWCKTGGLDSCGRAVCKGDSHENLNSLC